jgi:hypothetical protein
MDLGVIRLLTGLVLPLWLNPPSIQSIRIRLKYLTALRTLRLLMPLITEEVHLITVITAIRLHLIMQVRDTLDPSIMAIASIVIMHLMVHHRHLHTMADQEDTMIKIDHHHRTMDNLHLLIIHHIRRNLRRIRTDTPPEEVTMVTTIHILPIQVITGVLLQDLTMNTIDTITTTLTILTTNIITIIIKPRKMTSQA